MRKAKLKTRSIVYLTIIVVLVLSISTRIIISQEKILIKIARRLIDRMDKMSKKTESLERVQWFPSLMITSYALSKIRKAALPEILKACQNKGRDWKTRFELISGLSCIKGADSVITVPLKEILLDKDDNKHVRSVICTYVFAKLKDTTATDALIETMVDKRNPEKVRYHAAHTFVSLLHDERAVQPLLSVVEIDSSVEVRRIATAALGAIGCKTGNREMIQPLLAIAKDSGNPVQENAIYALGVIKAEEALPHILEIAYGKQGYHRYAAIWALGNLGGEDAKRVLFDIAFNDKEERVRIRAIKALIDIGDESIKTQIQEAINGIKDSGYRKVVIEKFSKTF